MQRNRLKEKKVKNKKDILDNNIEIIVNIGNETNDDHHSKTDSDNSYIIDDKPKVNKDKPKVTKDKPINNKPSKKNKDKPINNIKKKKEFYYNDENNSELKTKKLLDELKEKIKIFNIKKEKLISEKIDIPNDIFNLPKNIEINSEKDIISFIDIINNKILQLENIIPNQTKSQNNFPRQIPSSSSQIFGTGISLNDYKRPMPYIQQGYNPNLPYMMQQGYNPMQQGYNPMQQNLMNQLINQRPSNLNNAIEGPIIEEIDDEIDDEIIKDDEQIIKDDEQIIEDDETTTVDPDRQFVEDSPVEEEEISDDSLLLFTEEDFGRYTKYFFDNKNINDVSRLRKLINIQDNQLINLNRTKELLILNDNKSILQGMIEEVENNKSNTQIKLENLMNINNEDNFNENSDIIDNEANIDNPLVESASLNLLIERKNELNSYLEKSFESERSANAVEYLLVNLESRIEKIDYAINEVTKIPPNLTEEEVDEIVNDGVTQDVTYNENGERGNFATAIALRNTTIFNSPISYNLKRDDPNTAMLKLFVVPNPEDYADPILNAYQLYINNELIPQKYFNKFGDKYEMLDKPNSTGTLLDYGITIRPPIQDENEPPNRETITIDPDNRRPGRNDSEYQSSMDDFIVPNPNPDRDRNTTIP